MTFPYVKKGRGVEKGTGKGGASGGDAKGEPREAARESIPSRSGAEIFPGIRDEGLPFHDLGWQF